MMNKKALIIFLLLLTLSFGANAKVRDYWSNDVRHVVSDVHYDAAGKPALNWYINAWTRDNKNAFYHISLDLYTSSSDDPAFTKSHKMLIKLNNDEVITIPVHYEASPKVTHNYDPVYHTQSTSYEHYYPGWRVSLETLQKISTTGIKKVRIEHSKGYTDYNFDEKKSQKVTKSFTKMLNQVTEQLEKDPPKKPTTVPKPSTEF